MKIRTGFGYDVHRLQEGLPFWLGGIKIDHYKGAVGHSDADCLIHAICDALLGAANKRDIGYWFPDTSEEFKGIDSKILLQKTCDIIRQAGYEISNIDSTICLQKPKIKDYIPKMQEILTKTAQVDEDCISIKATTEEKLGFTGTEDGIACYAVCLIYKKD
ncbi:MAG: 2-C-methyl-D-erythritol 2,4-cyclodiphosphate synthase [Bacteroidales bacterium]|jgi:2-C-methyl-D-erythritol 2,4-cyclodiphosphate synthase|nr:2-C-methyl-D-erythritol 2,4-cyclodiphosphate synthase [Bacteroidales bacterium]MBR6278710.1 2-C-methyl-D-erythritol 2,4-cyclodiphosphate synthase [Bacteroidales bacterium]